MLLGYWFEFCVGVNKGIITKKRKKNITKRKRIKTKEPEMFVKIQAPVEDNEERDFTLLFRCTRQRWSAGLDPWALQTHHKDLSRDKWK